MEDNSAQMSPKRKRRIRRIRKFIFIGFPIIFISELALCIFLIARLNVLHRNLNRAKDEINAYLEMQSEWDFKESIRAGAEENILPASPVPVTDNPSENKADSKKESQQVLNPEEVKNLTLSNEELYDGYRKVYLTFDDGPSANTTAILDILKRYDVKATFFVIRREGRNNEKIYRRIVDEGHTLGMHSNTHEYSVCYASEEAFKNDTLTLRDFLYLVTGVESNVYRFPGGSSNRVSPVDVKFFANILHESGIEYYDWNVSAGDAVYPLPDADTIYRNVVNGIMNYDESIVLLHDLPSKKSTLEALPRIIEFIKSLDNTVILPITDSTVPIQHLIVNDNK